MSKTLGNVISPFDQVDKYGNEAVRYYMIAGLPTYGNASYKEEELINLHNSHLANSFGNLLNRVIHLANKKEVDLTGPISSDIQTKIAQYNQDIQQAYNNYQLYDAANITHKVALYANEYISRPGQEPWNKEISAQDAAQVLIDCGAMLQTIITGYQPIIPNKCEQAQTMLDTQTKGILFDRISKE